MSAGSGVRRGACRLSVLGLPLKCESMSTNIFPLIDTSPSSAPDTTTLDKSDWLAGLVARAEINHLLGIGSKYISLTYLAGATMRIAVLSL